MGLSVWLAFDLFSFIWLFGVDLVWGFAATVCVLCLVAILVPVVCVFVAMVFISFVWRFVDCILLVSWVVCVVGTVFSLGVSGVGFFGFWL